MRSWPPFQPEGPSMRASRLLLPLLLWVGTAPPATAAVTVTFWSHELGNDFPHAFLTLRGTIDATGQPVDVSYGFTARSISPAILMGKVKSRMDVTKPGYIRRSDAQFSVTVTDAQYGAVLALVQAWSGNRVPYDLDTANCIHFTKEAARLLGLTGLDQPRLMRRPRSYLQAVAAANPGRVVVVRQHGKAYLDALPPLGQAAVPPPAAVQAAIQPPAAAQAAIQPPAAAQAAVQPPSTDRLAPVIEAASSRQR